MARSKKEIDKELMYKKLMPTAAAVSEGEATLPAAPPIAPPAKEPVADVAAPAVPAAAQEPAISPAAAIVSGNAKQPEGELVNVMEFLVNERIDAAMEKFRCCSCEKCKKDITAITLNKLIPCYIVSTDSSKRVEADTKYAGQVATGLVQAILTVKAHPSHE